MANDPAETEPKDSFDEVLRRAVTGDATPHLAPGTVISDRFRVERMIGSGGMGAVYVARDQTLARDVAIKLHHTPGGAFRLRREAMAMARLAHPNVVTVFEVGELDRFPFVVMEYVPGTTLRAWLAEQKRSVGEILDMLLAAGEGLAAAHDAGLIHRDVKPENVLIGSDGRARVGDFGLARELDSQDDPPAGAPPNLLAPMTQTGAVLGTPAYMAPEQLGGAEVDARADQFAFCVTAWEALWGERPFRASTLDELMRMIKARELREPPPLPKVPARFRAALERGLAADPAARFPTMHALLDALRAPLRRRRLRFVVAAAGLGLAAAATVTVLLLARSSGISCDDAGTAETALLPHEIVGRIEKLGAGDDARRVGDVLHHFETSLVERARAGCQAEARHDWSPELHAKSTACLGIAARTMRDLLRPASLSKESVPEVVARAHMGMPAIASCSSTTYLAASPALPEDPVQLEAVIAARTDLALAFIELGAHHGDRAQPYLDRVERSLVRESPLIKPGLLVVRAAAATRRGDEALAEKLAADAYYAARTVDDDVSLSAALNLLLSLASEKPPEDPMVAMWMRTANADAERLVARDRWKAIGLYLDAAHVADLTDDGTAALRYVKLSRDLTTPDDEDALERGWLIEGDVLMWSGHVPEGIAAYDKAIASQVKRLGPDHPTVGENLADYASSLLEADRLEQALAVARRSIAIVEKSADPSDPVADAARINLAAVLTQSGHDDEARALYEGARARYVAVGGAHTSVVANIDMNLAILLLDKDETPRAIALLEEALATDIDILGPDRIENAQILFNLAVAYRKANDLPAALKAAQRNADFYERKRPGVDRHAIALAMLAAIANQLRDYPTALAATETALTFKPGDNPQATAWAQLERGRALIAVGRTPEARPLLAAARAAYLAVPLPDRVAEIDRLTGQSR